MTKKPDDGPGKDKDFLEELAGDDPKKVIDLKTWDAKKKAKASLPPQAGTQSGLLEAIPGYPLTHRGQAALFRDRWKGRVKFVGKKAGVDDSFFFFDGVRWVEDVTGVAWGEIYKLMDEQIPILKEMLDHAVTVKEAEQLQAAVRWCSERRNIASILDWAQKFPEVRAKITDFDNNPWLVGTPGGVVDLRTGQIRPAKPEDMISRVTAIAPAPKGTPCTEWNTFTHRIFRKEGGTPDTELICYMERMMGYALCGDKTEQKFIFAWGSGGNGKGVYFNTIAGIFGDYARHASADTFMARHFDPPTPTDVADLHGARLVVASELPEGKAWDEPKLKKMTGQDTVQARNLYARQFHYVPTYLLCFQGNVKPTFKNVGEAIERRLDMVPFLQNIPKEERKPELTKKLQDEWPAIFRRLIDACLQWQKDKKIETPAVVAEASREYLENEDVIGQWLKERTKAKPPEAKYEILSLLLFEDWTRWSAARGIKRFQSTRSFGDALTAKGIKKGRDKKGNVLRLDLYLYPTGHGPGDPEAKD
jgi:putative DNA primase/helicase